MKLRCAAFVLSLAGLSAACSGSSQNDASDVARDRSDVLVDGSADATSDIADVQADAGPSGIGNPCTGSGSFPPVQGDCADGQLCLEDNAGFPTGYCSQDCSTAPCPSDSACVMGMGFSVCLLRCASDADCRQDQGYACQMSMSAGARVCVPSGGPVGERDGGACYTTTAGPNQLQPLAHHVFSLPNVAASARSDVMSAAEGNVVVSPTNGAISGSYIAVGGSAVFMGSDTTRNGVTIDASGTVNEPSLPNTSDPVLTYTQDGRLWMIYIAYSFTASGMMTGTRIRVASSLDDGHTWGVPVGIEPLSTCATGCDKPWITSGPAPALASGGTDGGVDGSGGFDGATDAGNGENLYAGFLAQTASAANLMFMRSEDHGLSWSPPLAYAGVAAVGGSTIVPNLQTLVVAADGTLHATYAGISTSGTMASNWGDPGNRIAYRHSSDGGRTWSAASAVSGPSDSVVYNQPFLALDGSTIYIVYTNGTPNGAWDIILATSNDAGATWNRRKVNDEPDSCATHAFPQLVADTAHHVAHVTWLENRFGTGSAAYANCPQSVALPCSANEAISDHAFVFATSRDPAVWHGDYQGLTLAPTGTLWAYWSDTRTGTPQMYLSGGTAP